MNIDYEGLTVERLTDGGYVVHDAGSRFDPGRYRAPLFASTNLSETLAYVGRKLAPGGNPNVEGIKACDTVSKPLGPVKASTCPKCKASELRPSDHCNHADCPRP